jgi:hypothetical protein
VALTDYQPETSTIEFAKGGSFTVRGLSLDIISALVRKHLPDLDKLVALAIDAIPQDGGFGAGEAMYVAQRLTTEAPGLVSSIIAMASDSPSEEGAKAAAQLGIAKQIEAITEIGRLTFEEVGGVKKFSTWLIQIISTNLPRDVQSNLVKKAPQLFSTMLSDQT